MTSQLAPQDRAFYRHWHQVPIRHADLDDLGHVNNTVYAVYCEEARRHLFKQMQHDHTFLFFIARLVVDFHREITWPGVIEIGTAVKHIGNSSFTMTQGLFSADICHASVEVVSVIASRQTRRPTPIPVPLREFLVSMLPG
jgi:acyl-CoA thioester hydrolase